MANLINNQISYTVKNNGEWFYKSLKKAHTLANDYIRVIPNVTKDGLPESAGKGLLCVITVLQITTPPYGLIIDLSI